MKKKIILLFKSQEVVLISIFCSRSLEQFGKISYQAPRQYKLNFSTLGLITGSISLDQSNLGNLEFGNFLQIKEVYK